MTHVNLYIKDETLEGLRIQAEQLGTGFQTLINGILKKHLKSEEDVFDLPLESQPLNKELPIVAERIDSSSNGQGLVEKAGDGGYIEHRSL